MLKIDAPTYLQPNFKQFGRLMYRAIRMGWTPDNSELGWENKHYDATVDTLPADMLLTDWDHFRNSYTNTVGWITKMEIRTHPQLWKKFYTRLKGITMQQIDMTIITSWEHEELIATIIGAADDIVNDFKIGKHESPIITSHRRTDDNDVHMYWVSLNMGCEEDELENISAALRSAIYDELGNGFVLPDHQGFVIGRLHIKE